VGQTHPNSFFAPSFPNLLPSRRKAPKPEKEKRQRAVESGEGCGGGDVEIGAIIITSRTTGMYDAPTKRRENEEKEGQLSPDDKQRILNGHDARQAKNTEIRKVEKGRDKTNRGARKENLGRGGGKASGTYISPSKPQRSSKPYAAGPSTVLVRSN
jgi:hypothetical protein